VEPEDPAGFAEAVRQLLAEPELAAARGAAGRRLVEERYGKEAVLQELERELMGLSLGARSAAKLP
jgi:glycosyltransferase involved in cell wall biosynthesis